MKKLIVSFLLLALSTPALAIQPNFEEQIEFCVSMSTEYTQLATMADDAQDSDHAAFVAFVQQEAESFHNEKAKQSIIHIGQLAWLSRGHDIHGNAIKMFKECYSHLGTKL